MAAVAATPSNAITFTPATSPSLDLSQLGRVGLAGDFSGISLFQFQEQTEAPFTNNGTEALYARMPNGAFAPIAQTDASILAMCDFTSSNGSSAGVVLGGNFTSFGGKESPGIAMFNPNTSAITPMTRLSGQVNALLCDQDTNKVYIGGSFIGGNSTNALAWDASTGLVNLPFAGFNGPVTSITKASNGHIIFGGSFTGLGNTSIGSTPDSQIINLSTATITTTNNASTAGFGDPKNIICKTGGVDGSGNTWLLQDNTAGSWGATFGFGFQPSKLRLYNTHQDGRGTKEWRFTALPLNGIMNFTYIDPADGSNKSCTSVCPLSNSTSVPYQDFHFVNTVGMNQFRIDISAWYGAGGGLDGIELFENDIFSYAIDDFNEPSCANTTLRSTATKTGAWTVTPSRSSTSDYLSVVLSSPISSSAASIVFAPDIKESGDYSVNVYTPGCLQDNTCSTRGQFTITGSMTTDGKNNFQATLFQTNNYDKYDQIYFGKIDAGSASFRPQVTMTPVAGQDLSSMTFVAQKIGFTLINSTGGLTGLFEYDPTKNTVNSSDFSSSAFDQLGASFTTGSAVNALATSGDVTFIGGNFSSPNASNLVSLNSNSKTAQSLDGGLNGQVLTMVMNDTKLFVGGDFTSNRDNTSTGLNHVAVYDTSSNSWSTLGAGVNGKVLSVVLLTMNVTSTTPEVVVGVTGHFDQLEAFGSNAAVSVSGFGVWVPSQNNWLQNLALSVESLNGILSSSLINIEGGQALYGGSLSSSTLSADGVVDLSSTTSINRFPVNISASQVSSNSVSKRDTVPNATISGVVTGVFDTSNSRNNTILAGHFTATASNGSTINNILILEGLNTTTSIGAGVSSNSTFLALAVQGDLLFAGGNVTGTIAGDPVAGLITYNLASSTFNTQPPSLAGGNTTVSAIAPRPSSGDVYVGGDFLTAGSLGCPGVCFFSTSSSQWNRPGTNLDGTVNSMIWTGSSTLVAGGNLSVNSSGSSTYLVTYDASKQSWDSYPGANQLPGPVSIVTTASSDGSQLWVAGTASNGSVYFMKYDGSNWLTPSVTLSNGSILRGLQVFTTTSSHDSTTIMDQNQVLMLTGSLVLSGYGAASAATFNGTAFTPFALTMNSGNTPGSLSRVFVEKSNFFASSNGHLPLVFVVLIGLGISLALMLIIVVAGLFLDRLRKKREGYIPAPTSMYDRGSGLQRIPPHELLENLNKGRPGAPHV